MEGRRCLVLRRLLGDAAGGLGGCAGVHLSLLEEGLHVAAPRHGSGDRSAEKGGTGLGGERGWAECGGG
jgi:hypothetical protein